MSEHTEKILKERVVYTGRVFTVVERDIETKPGQVVTWEVIKKRGENTVVVVTVDAERNVYLVEEYFGGIDERALRAPTGKIDAGEAPEAAALREMQEEIGYKGKLVELAKVSVSPGYMTQRTICYLAIGLKPSRLTGDEDDHHFIVKKVLLEQAVAMCENGTISEARTVAALLLAAKKLVA